MKLNNGIFFFLSFWSSETDSNFFANVVSPPCMYHFTDLRFRHYIVLSALSNCEEDHHEW